MFNNFYQNQENHINDLAPAHPSLQRAGILIPENFSVVTQHGNLGGLAPALYYLQEARILSQENFNSVEQHSNPIDLSTVLCVLQRAGILTPENFSVVTQHADPENLASALSLLQEAWVLNQDNFNVVKQHADPENLASALSLLQEAGILNQDNFNVVEQHVNPFSLASALYNLHLTSILNQANFNNLLHPEYAFLFTDDAIEHAWHRIPGHLLTQANFEGLLTAARQENPLEVLIRTVETIINHAEPLQRHNPINNAQSTHTASVHKSVSESATKLMQHYGETLNLEVTIQKIKSYVQGLPDTYTGSDKAKKEAIVKAAKTCIKKLTASDYYFADSSGVSTRQLLALAFTAIHDDTKRNGTLEDARAQCIEGLYEIQRGYNINTNGVDDGGDDRPICTSGTFNKIMEKLNGIHSDVEICYITTGTASLKFPKLAIEHALVYLNSIASPLTPLDYQTSKAIIDNMKASDSLESIWDKIEDKVRREIWGEFKEAYGNNPKDPRFIALMNCWQFVKAPELSDIEKQLEGSRGFRDFIGLSANSFWTNRNVNDSAHEAFDSRYGL